MKIKMKKIGLFLCFAGCLIIGIVIGKKEWHESPSDELRAKLAACTEQNNVLLGYMKDLKKLNSANPPFFDLASKQIACRDTIMIYINFLSDLWKCLDSISINDQKKANLLPFSPYELGIYVGRFKAFSGIMDTIEVFLAPRIN